MYGRRIQNMELSQDYTDLITKSVFIINKGQ